MSVFIRLANFRDLGGLRTSDGRAVRSKRLLRAAQPVLLSDEDISRLRAHDLKCIVDFRTAHEVAATPVDKIDGVSYLHIDILGKNSAKAADTSYWTGLFLSSPEKVEEEFTNTYREFAISENSMHGYSEFIKACVALHGGATLFHCAAGKDRTGFAAAIILKMLGVHEDDIFADYLETIKYQHEVRERHIKLAKENGANDEQIQAMSAIFGVKPGYLSAAFEAAEKAFGSFDSYVKNGLRISPPEVERLKEHYLA
ncbi:MAG: tyrosine-protein phosphatase [Defluviitaleaceae bacterium]|nr:tyrosine-protein phosphatase [Defluviitaleaceae bacterium]